MVTSSAVVGSSAISSLGSQASAIAIITRWRMPPESWCGYCVARGARGSGMSHQPQHLDGARRGVARGEAADAASASRRSGAPIVSTGLSEVIGSWKIIEICVAADARASRRSLQRQQIAPFEADARRATMRPGGDAMSRRIESAVTLLPQPISPTTASVSPASTAKETPSTARTTPSRVKKCVRADPSTREA